MSDIQMNESYHDRLQHIDALRGFAMMLVVFVHIELFGVFEFTHTTLLAKMFSAVHMPLFFFISGLCIYRPNKTYNRSRIYGDIKRLILPALSIGLLYTYFKINQDFVYFFSNNMKSGYWFTISLFEILLIYYLISNITKNSSKGFLISLCAGALFLYLLRLPLKISPMATMIADYLCFHQTCSYFLYFVLGVFASKYKGVVSVWITSRWLPTVAILVFTIFSYLMFVFLPRFGVYGITGQVVESIGETLFGIFGLAILYIIFDRYKLFFNNNNIVGKCLIIIGNNTLAIYLLHYFLLPHLPLIGNCIKDSSNVLCELIIIIPLSLLIISLSFLVAKVIRLSPILGKILLGDKG